MRTRTNVRRRVVRLLAVAAALLAVAGPAAGVAHADAFGQIGTWGRPGFPPAAGEFYLPMEIGVDPSDANSVYVVDSASDQSTFRLQKFSSDGSTVLATASIPRPIDPDVGVGPMVLGVVVDPSLHRVYLLKFAYDPVSFNPVATDILVYSTQPVGGALVAPQDVPSGRLAVPDSTGVNALVTPVGFTVDRRTHDLLVLSYDNSVHVVIQRVGSDGTPGTRYVDSTGTTFRTTPFNVYPNLNGIAVDGDGDVFVSGGTNQSGIYLYELPPALDRVTPVAQPGTGVALEEGWSQATGGLQADALTAGFGPQLAVSDDGRTLFWSEQATADSDSVPGSYTIRGYSIATGRTTVLYGGGTSGTCQITHRGAGIATGSGDVVYALDHGNYLSTPPTYGERVVAFGPGGSGCPAPVAKLRVGSSDDASVTVQKGESVRFDASGSDFHGATPSELAWDFDGSGQYRDVVTGSPAATSINHTFLTPGTFTVSLRMRVTGTTLGNPPAIAKTVVVRAGTPRPAFTSSTRSPAAGGTVTFDASTSLDPTGSASGGPSRTLRTYSWDFGDGARQDTSTATVDHVFANPSASPVQRTVRLTVTSFDGIRSTLTATDTITVQGTADNRQPTNPGPGDGNRIPTTPVVPDPGKATLSTAALRSSNAALGIVCAASPGACSGTIVLVATLPAPRGRRGHRARAVATTVGTASFSLAAGARGTIVVKLSRAARAALARARRLGVTVRIETRNSAGKTASSTKRVTLVVPRARRRAARRH